MPLLASLREQTRALRRHTQTVYFAARDPRTPLLVRALALLVAAYALSPIDLVPDFIPVLGALDDLLLIPLGLALVVRWTPPEVLAAARERAEHEATRPVSYTAAAAIAALWILALWTLVRSFAG